MPAITAASPGWSDKIITVTKPLSLSGLCILITGVRYAAPAVYVQLTQRCPSKFARRLQPHTPTHTEALRRSSGKHRLPKSFSAQRRHNRVIITRFSTSGDRGQELKSFPKTITKPSVRQASMLRAAAVFEVLLRKGEHYIFLPPRQQD